MACDLAIASDDSIFRHVGLQHGSVPAGGATQWLPLIIGDRRAREMIMLCEDIPAAKALDWGLINRVTTRDDLDAAVDEWVGKLAARLPEVTRYAKHQLNYFRDLSWHQTVGHARDWLTLHAGDDETRGAVEAFLERRRRRSGP
jgi:enoyl-CoA hydratase/carnithine racemase